MSKTLQNILILTGILLIGVVGWYMYTENKKMALDTEGSEQIQAEIQGFIQTQNTLKNVEINTDILNDERFQALQKVSESVTPQPRGRNNPFVSDF